MPSMVTHDLFGRMVLARLDEDIKNIILKYPKPFHMGLQGPDILFFHKPLTKSAVSEFGFGMHREKASVFFNQALELMQEEEKDSAYASYLYGFVCHFILDSECHPYIARVIEEYGMDHNEIESEFDKYLLKALDMNPKRFRSDSLIYDDEDTIEAIHLFYPTITKEELRQSLKDMKMVKKVLFAPNIIKQRVIYTSMKMVGKYQSLYGIVMNVKDNKDCMMTNVRLNEIFKDAVKIACDMIIDFSYSLNEGKPLNDRFDRNFE